MDASLGRRATDAADLMQLRALLDDVVVARSAQRAQSAERGAHSTAVRSAWLDSLRALEAYADALERRRLPVPRKILQDIRLHRALCNVSPD